MVAAVAVRERLQLGMPGGDGAPNFGLGGAGGDTTANPPAVGADGAFRDGTNALRPASTPNPTDSGGGGGGFGRIWVRTRGSAPNLTGGQFAPDAKVDTTL